MLSHNVNKTRRKKITQQCSKILLYSENKYTTHISLITLKALLKILTF